MVFACENNEMRGTLACLNKTCHAVAHVRLREFIVSKEVSYVPCWAGAKVDGIIFLCFNTLSL